MRHITVDGHEFEYQWNDLGTKLELRIYCKSTVVSIREFNLLIDQTENTVQYVIKQMVNEYDKLYR